MTLSDLAFWKKPVFKNIFSSGRKAKVNGGGGMKQFLSKISGAFMLPISVMAIAGLFLGVGAAIASHAGGNEDLIKFGKFIQNLGDPVFGAMPMLFAAAIVVAFTDEAGVGVFAAIIGMLIFSAIQSVFIDSVDHTNYYVNNINGNTVDHSTLGLSKFFDAQGALKLDANGAVDQSNLDALNKALAGLQNIGTGHIRADGSDIYATIDKAHQVHAVATDTLTTLTTKVNAAYQASLVGVKDAKGVDVSTTVVVDLAKLTSTSVHDGFTVLFGGGGRSAANLNKLVGSTLGIQSLNTSVFGGIVVGAIVAYLYNKFHTIALPQVISFFGGKRFVSLVTILAMVPTALIFLILWPWVGFALSKFGEATGKVPYGFESFIFGFIERSLIPFGLHHVFYAPLWWTNAGGDATSQIVEFTNNDAHILVGASSDLKETIFGNKDKWVGDSTMWQAANGLKYSQVFWVDTNGFTQLQIENLKKVDLTDLTAVKANLETIKQAGALHSNDVFPFMAKQLEIKLGRYMQGKFPFMIFGLPMAGLAMVLAAPKENRKVALGTVFPAAVTSFVTGVTEPIEFTFLFLAPWLFWGFHAFFAAVSFMLMNLFGAHIGMTFSGGFLDLMIYGAIPFSKGTAFYWAFVLGAAYMPIYFFGFYFAIKKFNLDTPGRGGNTKLFTKKDFQNAKGGAKGALTAQGAAIIAGAGGWDNITNYTNCATRLRYDVKDLKKVDDSALKAAGAVGIARVGGNHVQIIMGPVAEQVNTNIKNNIGADLGAASGVKETLTKKPAHHAKATGVHSPLAGTVKTIESLKDGVFSEKMMGDGIVVAAPKNAKTADYYAPISGELVTVFPTGHAYGIKSEDGLEVLLHIGLDTVNLEGKGFTPVVKQGQKVKAGDKLATVDLVYVSKHAPSADAIIVVTSGEKLTNKAKGEVTTSSILFDTK